MPTKDGNAWLASANSAQQKMPSPTILRRTPMMSMVMVPVTKVVRVAPSTTTTARSKE
jgi:hypothetical protein